SAAPPGRVRELAGFRDEDAVADARVRLSEFLQELAGQDEATERPRRDDVGDWGLAQQDGDLPEELAAPERIYAFTTRDHCGLAVEDDVKGRAGEAFAEDTLVLSEVALLEGVGDPLNLGAGEIGEDREAGERFADVVGRRAHRCCL